MEKSLSDHAWPCLRLLRVSASFFTTNSPFNIWLLNVRHKLCSIVLDTVAVITWILPDHTRSAPLSHHSASQFCWPGGLPPDWYQCTCTTQHSKISASAPHSTKRSVHVHHAAQQYQCTCTTQHSKISAPAPHSTAKSAHLYHTALQESVGVHRSIPDIRILNTQQLEYFDIHIFTLSNYLISYNYLKNLIIRTDRTCYGLKQYLEWEMYSHFLKNLPPLILFTCLVFNA